MFLIMNPGFSFCRPAALPLAGTTGEFRSGSRRYVWLEFGRAAPELPAIPARDESR